MVSPGVDDPVDPRRAPTDAAAGVLDVIADMVGERCTRHAPLGARTTYRVGGRAGLLVEVHGEDDLVALHGALVAARSPVPLLVLGEGSNLLVADAGFPGVVVRLGAEFERVEMGATSVRAGGAAKLPVVARQTAAAGRHGLEWAVGVPGSVGGALRMNAGGHGSDVAAVLSRVGVFDLSTGDRLELLPEHLALGYRTSSLRAGDVVVWAEFALQAGDRVRAEQTVADIVRWRRANQPGGSNAGSVFVNPDADSAGRLVESAGLKGLRLGTAQVSPKHANFIQADRGGSADDVWRLVEHLRAEVETRTGVALVPEVRMVGFPGGLPTVHAKPSTSTEGRGS
jgi:UDP-N-acetylmuramate dehydrogenase